MRDVNRIYDILVKFQDLWEQYPDQRFGQIISNYLVNDKEDILSDIDAKLYAEREEKTDEKMP